MIKYNLDYLVSVEVVNRKKSDLFKYLPEKSLFGIVLRKEGIVNMGDLKKMVGSLDENNLVLIDNVVYEKPTVILSFVDNSIQSYSFDTNDEAKEFADRRTAIGRWIKAK